MAQIPGVEQTFTYRSAHATPIIVAIGALLLIETTVLHLWLHPTYPMVAWLLSAASIATLGWLIMDHRRYIRGAVRTTEDRVLIALGSRWRSAIPRAQIVRVYRPSWRDLPDPLTSSAGFLSAMKPVEPNVVIRCEPPAMVRVFGAVMRPYASVGLHLDAPDEFVKALNVPSVGGRGVERVKRPPSIV